MALREVAMRFQDISVGDDYGIRIKVAVGEPLLRVTVLEKVDRAKKLRVRHVSEPHAGMEEFLAQRHVIVAWPEREPYLRDELRLERVRASSLPYGDAVIVETVQLVLDASGEDVFVHSVGRTSMPKAAFERIAARAGLAADAVSLDPVAFIDRDGRCELSLRGAEHLARAFAAAEPDAVTMYVASDEDRYVSQGYAVGEHWWHDELRKRRPAFALARSWAGFEQEVARLTGEVQRLRNLLAMAESDLRRAGDPQSAVRLHRAVGGG